jgi:hypothetical protein
MKVVLFAFLAFLFCCSGTTDGGNTLLYVRVKPVVMSIAYIFVTVTGFWVDKDSGWNFRRCLVE